MFHLDHDADGPPESPAQLREAVLGTLRNEMTLDPKHSAVVIDDAAEGDADLIVSLTGARVSTDVPPKKPAPVGERRPGPDFRHVKVHAEPMSLDEARVTLDLDARGVRCVYDRDADDGRWVLMLDDVADGRVDVAIPQADLHALIERKVREGAKQQDAQVDRVDLTLAQAGPRSVSVKATVSGGKKVAFLTAPFTADVLGELHVDDDLEARLENLSVEGHGKVLSMLTGLLEPKLREVERKRLPLTALPLGQARIRDVSVTVGDDVKVHASFGK